MQSLGQRPLWRADHRNLRTVFQDFVLSATKVTQLLEPLVLCNLEKPSPSASSWVPKLPDSMSGRDLDSVKAAGDTRARAVDQGNGILDVSRILTKSISDIVYLNTPVAGRANSLYNDLCSESRNWWK